MNGTESKSCCSIWFKKCSNNNGGNKKWKSGLSFVEIMACPGGCIMGGGQQ